MSQCITMRETCGFSPQRVHKGTLCRLGKRIWRCAELLTRPIHLSPAMSCSFSSLSLKLSLLAIAQVRSFSLSSEAPRIFCVASFHGIGSFKALFSLSLRKPTEARISNYSVKKILGIEMPFQSQLQSVCGALTLDFPPQTLHTGTHKTPRTCSKMGFKVGGTYCRQATWWIFFIPAVLALLFQECLRVWTLSKARHHVGRAIAPKTVFLRPSGSGIGKCSMRRIAYGNPAYLRVLRIIVCASGMLYLSKPEELTMTL